jgi:hypothetical protein
MFVVCGDAFACREDDDEDGYSGMDCRDVLMSRRVPTPPPMSYLLWYHIVSYLLFDLEDRDIKVL